MTASSTTRRRVAWLAAAAAAVIAVGVGPALADSSTYVGGAGGAFLCRGPGSLNDQVPVQTPGLGVGGACFSIPPGARTVAVTATDDVGGPTAIRVTGHQPDQTQSDGPVFCDGSGTWTIPSNVDIVFVAELDPVTSGCANAPVPVKGTITATFS